ncbi:isoprenylcysteine carboxyl methyltransferase [Nanobdella aerobiophila]|uniref:Isoprenylcysteine carboxyl methyltransferase n=1 Tax=Nanobdella aerobiophila TaxID=2586965 RepID=A0A915SEU6_9ARCH|nr:isoprenylcysteine carboxylmethyltransferase family protein [Nanobdella aerobiophila]BBL45255.1 isoprenylcysteine carboxyl methyltransferase [Nanobdella aerobiophila]
MIINFALEEYLYLFIVSEIVVGIVMPFIILKGEKEKVIQYKLYSLIESILYILIGMTFIAIFASIGQFYNYGIFNYSTGNIVGFLLFLIGILYQGIAEASLGKYYLPYLGIAEGQKIIKNGIYKYIRHPGYFGEMLIFLGFGFVTYNILGIIIALIVDIFIYIGEVLPEEQYLENNFGQEYKDYKKETYRFIPYIF